LDLPPPISKRAWDKHAILDNRGCIIGIHDDAPEWAREAYNMQLTYHDWVINKMQNNLTDLQSNGFKHYCYTATLDASTCPICGSLDGKIFKITDSVIGVNTPPIHLKCRCSVTVVFDDETLTNSKRIARDKNGRNIFVPANMFYHEYREEYLK